MAAPNRAERENCWNARDDYWDCVEAKTADNEKCKKLRKVFEESCSKSWVQYFDKRRDYLKFKAKLESGEIKDPVDVRAEAKTS
ncbi:hypothetical protein ACJMK2_036564 [Sinanodonta woodiana]|uniref:Cytochrome c oxidase assembly factor 6 homolog n=1 Tax=Sinanodonta woodiana TaxID=1069815 RepID=A0ABD3WL61_SINWO